MNCLFIVPINFVYNVLNKPPLLFSTLYIGLSYFYFDFNRNRMNQLYALHQNLNYHFYLYEQEKKKRISKM